MSHRATLWQLTPPTLVHCYSKTCRLTLPRCQARPPAEDFWMSTQLSPMQSNQHVLSICSASVLVDMHRAWSLFVRTVEYRWTEMFIGCMMHRHPTAWMHWRNIVIKKRSERRKHCALAVVRRSQKFSPAADPLPGGAGRPKFNQLEMVTTFTYNPSLVKIDARNFEYNRPDRKSVV